MSKEELRHCPYCGGKAKVKTADELVWVECKKCDECTTKYPEDARELAIAEWNGEEYD